MEEAQLSTIQKLNLLWVVIITIGVSTILVFLSFVIFLKSGAYDTVKQISAAEDVLAESIEGIDTTSPIQARDLDEYAESLPQRVKLLNDAEEFNKVSL